MEALAFKDDMAGSTGAAAANTLQLIAFSIGEQTYGVEITTVREIRAWNGATPLPNTREYVRGVINLRGTIVPVVDMRVKFRLARADYGPTTVMIVLNVGGRIVGMVVDSVSDVIRLSDAQVRPVPDVGCPIERRFLTGIGTLDERMLILLDIERLMASTEMGLVMEEAA